VRIKTTIRRPGTFPLIGGHHYFLGIKVLYLWERSKWNPLNTKAANIWTQIHSMYGQSVRERNEYCSRCLKDSREYRQWYYRTRKHWSRPTTFLAKFRDGWNNLQNYDDTTRNSNTLTTHLQTFTDNQGSKTLGPDVSLQEYLGYCTPAEQHSDMLQRHHSTSWSLFSDVIEIVSDSGPRILISIHPTYS
jgi:hypothetical protein